MGRGCGQWLASRRGVQGRAQDCQLGVSRARWHQVPHKARTELRPEPRSLCPSRDHTTPSRLTSTAASSLISSPPSRPHSGMRPSATRSVSCVPLPTLPSLRAGRTTSRILACASSSSRTRLTSHRAPRSWPRCRRVRRGAGTAGPPYHQSAAPSRTLARARSARSELACLLELAVEQGSEHVIVHTHTQEEECEGKRARGKRTKKLK